MNILHVNLQKGWRGGEQQLAHLMLGLNKRGVFQILLCSEGGELSKFASQNSIKHHSVKEGLLSKFANVVKFVRIIKESNIDIVHCHESKGHTLLLLSKLLGLISVKAVLHRRVIFPIAGFFSRNLKYSNRIIDKVICVSKAVQSVFLESVEAKNTIVIYDAADLPFGSKKSGVLKLKNATGKVIIGYIAALTFEKDHLTFLETAKELLNERSNIHFVIVGDGPLRTTLEKFCITHHLSNDVTFTGFINNARSLIPEIDILLFTSVREGLGSTILDFFAAKKPVVAVDSGGVAEIVIDQKTGFLCPPKNVPCLKKKVNILLDNSEVINRLTSAAFSFVNENFGEERMVSKTIDVYDELIRESSSRA